MAIPNTLARSIQSAMLAAPAALAAACGRPQATPHVDAPPRQTPAPPSIEMVRVVEQPLDVQLSLPGELAAYQIRGHLSEGDRVREDRRTWIAGPW